MSLSVVVPGHQEQGWEGTEMGGNKDGREGTGMGGRREQGWEGGNRDGREEGWEGTKMGGREQGWEGTGMGMGGRREQGWEVELTLVGTVQVGLHILCWDLAELAKRLSCFHLLYVAISLMW